MSSAASARWAFARELGLGLLAAAAAGLASSAVLVVVVLVLVVPGSARAGEGEPPPVGPASAGLLLSGGQEGLYRHAPLQATDVRLSVSGMVVRARVRQRFHNPHRDWVEGVYVFPLPEEAAVDRLRLQVGERMILGEIRERAGARRSYAQARAQGRRAGLVEQERPNVFTSSVANIGPGDTVTVELEYQQHLRFRDGGFQLRFPTVVGPRYLPGNVVPAVADHRTTPQALGWAAATDRVPDATRISPPVLAPGEPRRNPVSLRVDLDAGFPLAAVASPFHRVHTTFEAADRATVVLQDGVVAERDFTLEWRPAPGAEPRAALFREAHAGHEYVLMMLLPPEQERAMGRVPPREVIFVVDTSGSMAGASMDQARAAVDLALGRLRPEDRFNIIQFNSRTEALFDEPRAAEESNLKRARHYVGRLAAEGGTEMMPALALALDGEAPLGHVRQVVFLTDGAIGNEQETFALVQQRLGDSRLFTVGIGSAPNGHFMARAARFGRGTFTYIGAGDQVGEKMDALLAKLEHPALTDVRVSWPDGVAAEVWPARLPDLYLGEPLVFSARFDRLPDALTVSGRYDAEPWQLRMPLETRAAGTAPGIAALWARNKIAALMDGVVQGDDGDAVRQGVVQVALSHHLVSRYTSLVAVDRTPARPGDGALHSGSVPTNLPSGWEYEKVFGQLPQTATDSLWHMALGLLLLLLGAAVGTSAWRLAT